jgi:deoxyribose-phosphate aldolase
MHIAGKIEYSMLQPDITVAAVELACTQSQEYGFASVAVPPLFVKMARSFLGQDKVQLSAAVGFPFGFSIIEAKLSEIVMATVDGADEFDIAVNIHAIKNNDWQYIAKEVNTILPFIRSKAKRINLIIETDYLTKEALKACCDIYGAAGVDAIVTGSNFNNSEVHIETVQLLRTFLASAVKIKVAGGIKNYSFARQLLQAGADRISCTNGVQLIQENNRQN